MGDRPEARLSPPPNRPHPADSVEDEFELSTVCHRPEGLEQLQEQTKFTRKELQVLYRGFKNVSAKLSLTGEGRGLCRTFLASGSESDGEGKGQLLDRRACQFKKGAYRLACLLCAFYLCTWEKSSLQWKSYMVSPLETQRHPSSLGVSDHREWGGNVGEQMGGEWKRVSSFSLLSLPILPTGMS